MTRSTPPPPAMRALRRERFHLLRRIEDRLEWPMIVLGLVWLILLIVEFVRGLSPLLETAGTVIWILFILDFLLKFTLATRRWRYVKRNWLTVIALAVPALRVLRIGRAFALLRAARAARGLRLVRVVTSVNRGMSSLGATMSRRGFGYVVALTLIVTFAGAAGMLAFERDVPDRDGLHDYGSSLWWTAMLMTTNGSAYWPQTAEGRVHCFLMSLYAFAVFGYITATLASVFIDQDANSEKAGLAGAASIDALRDEIAGLRRAVEANPPRAGREESEG